VSPWTTRPSENWFHVLGVFELPPLVVKIREGLSKFWRATKGYAFS
jgi:hypothetical protein